MLEGIEAPPEAPPESHQSAPGEVRTSLAQRSPPDDCSPMLRTASPEGGRPRGPSTQRAQLPEGGRDRVPTRECAPALCNGSEVALPVRLSSGVNTRASLALGRKLTGSSRKLTLGSSRKTSNSPGHCRQTIEPPFATFDPTHEEPREESAQSSRLTVQEEVMAQNRAALLDYLRYGAVRFKSAQQEADYQEYTRRIDAARWVLFLRRFFALFCVGFVTFIVYDGAPHRPRPRISHRTQPHTCWSTTGSSTPACHGSPPLARATPRSPPLTTPQPPTALSGAATAPGCT